MRVGDYSREVSSGRKSLAAFLSLALGIGQSGPRNTLVRFRK